MRISVSSEEGMGFPVWAISAKGLFSNNVAKIALRFGSDLVVAISAKPQA